MSDEQPDRERRSLEETLRAIADEVTKGAERFASEGFGNIEDLARASGIDAEPIKQFAEDAGEWLRDQIAAATQSGGEVEPMPAADPSDPRDAAPRNPTPSTPDVPPAAAPPSPSPDATGVTGDRTTSDRVPGLPHPLDLPTEQQARALAALESGRWTVEPGTVVLATTLNRGTGPEDAHALGMELHVRDWVDVDGDLTFSGELALARWARVHERTTTGDAEQDD